MTACHYLVRLWVFKENEGGDENSGDKNVIKVKLKDKEEKTTIGVEVYQGKQRAEKKKD